jgi:dTMP kinase
MVFAGGTLVPTLRRDQCRKQKPESRLKETMKGRFITFEGSEGCGKSTQSHLLFEYLKKKRHKVIFLREPGGVKLSEQIRKLLLDPKSKISPEAETLLYMAARAQVVDEIIKPALSKGNIIVCDRFLDSTIAYQGYGLGIDIKAIKSMGAFATCGIKPDLTIFLNLPVKDGLKHRQKNKDRIESRDIAYHARVHQGYLKLARLEPKRIKVVNVQDNKDKTQENIRLLIDRLWLRRPDLTK